MRNTGQIIFAVSFAAIGVLSIAYADFAAAFELLPKFLAVHHLLVIVSGAVLLAGGIGLLLPKTARAGSLLLAVFLLLRLAFLHIPRVAGHPLTEVVYESMGENLIDLAGAWTIFCMLSRDTTARWSDVRAGQILFALALPAIGLSHFFYVNMTAPLIPAWLPFHVGLAYFTGAAWIAAALGILSGVLARLAAVLTAVMVSLFTLLVWIPMMIVAPTSRGNWAEICSSAAITGAAWAVAESFRGRSWGLARDRVMQAAPGG